MESKIRDYKTVANLLNILGFFGVAGLHRIYAKKYITGVMWFFTLGWFFIGTIMDFAAINKRPLEFFGHKLSLRKIDMSSTALDDLLFLDFETANRMQEICAIGMVRYVAGNVVSRERILCVPEYGFEPQHTWLHGLDRGEVEGGMTISKGISAILKNMGKNTIIVCHNAPFDLKVLLDNAVRHNIDLPVINALCTLELSRAFSPQLPNHKLSTLAKMVGQEVNHHDALSDTEATLAVYLAINNEISQNGGSIKSFMQNRGVGLYHLLDETITYDGVRIPFQYKRPFPTSEEERTSLSGKTFCFLGDLTYWNKNTATALVKDRGGSVVERESKKVDYIVVGERKFHTNPHEWANRIARARERAASNDGQLVLTDDEFVRMMERTIAGHSEDYHNQN